MCTALSVGRLSGLIADVLGDQIVVASSASWVEKYRETIEGALIASSGLGSITWRPSLEILKEEGLAIAAEDPSELSTEPGVRDDEIEVGAFDPRRYQVQLMFSFLELSVITSKDQVHTAAMSVRFLKSPNTKVTQDISEP